MSDVEGRGASDDAPASPRKGVGRKTLSGAKWMTGSQLTKQVVNLGVKLLLARLLAPEDFGIVALASTFVSFADNFVLGGFVEAMVQKEILDERTRDTAFWLHLALGLVSMLGLLLLAPIMASAFDSPDLAPVLRALAATLLLTGLTPTFEATLTRELRFRALGLRLIMGTLVGGAVGVAAGLAGWGAWALVLMLLVKVVVSTLAFIVADPWKPRFRFSRPDAAGLWLFARYQLGTKLLNFAQRNVDNLLVGGFLGVGALGVYSLAYQAVLIPLRYVTRPIISVVFAALCTLPDPRVRERAYLRTLEALLGLTWPLSVLGAISVPPLLPSLLGEKWSDVVPVFAILAMAPLFQSPKAAFHALAQANGAPKYVLHLQFLTWVLATLGFVAGLPFGVIGVAAGYTVASALTFPLTLYYLGRVDASPVATLRVVLRAAAVATLSGAGGFVTRHALTGYGTVAAAIGSGVSIGLLWMLLAWWILPELWKVARMLLQRRRRKASTTSPAA